MKIKFNNNTFIVRILYLLIKIIFYSSRINILGKSYLPEKSGQKNNTIILVWHGNMLIPIYALRKGKYSLLIGLHRDAELLNSFTSFLGYPSIRGSSNKRPIGAVINLVREMRKNVVAITPDGPRGPRRVVKTSTAKVLKKIEPVITPIGSSSSKRIVLRTWDNFEIPLPFSKISIVIGKPFKINIKESPEEISNFIKSKIDEVQYRAESLS